MIKERIQDEINKQINAELYSAYLYLSMSAYCESLNLKGLGNWLRVQSKEELFHVSKFYDYVIQRGGKVVLESIDKPPLEWSSPLAVFEDAYKHEQKVTGMINNLVGLASHENDYATYNFLQWFVAEQVEEEAAAEEVVNKLRLIAHSSSALFMLDNELALRVFTPPVKQTGA